MLSMLKREVRGAQQWDRLEGSDSEGNEDQTGKGQGSTTKDFAKYAAYEKETRVRPSRVLGEYREFVKIRWWLQALAHHRSCWPS